MRLFKEVRDVAEIVFLSPRNALLVVSGDDIPERLNSDLAEDHRRRPTRRVDGSKHAFEYCGSSMKIGQEPKARGSSVLFRVGDQTPQVDEVREIDGIGLRHS